MLGCPDKYQRLAGELAAAAGPGRSGGKAARPD